MKKTITVNLGGMVYHIDEDAYALLSNYLDSIHQELKNMDGATEIYTDIEARIADIIREKLMNKRKIVTIKDVEEIIGMMGQPGDISGKGSSDRARTENKYYKRMYRDPENSMIGGVCSGMAAYWNIDPTLVRIIFILLVVFGMAGLLIYLILWIVLPEARTISQKLEMRGEAVTLSSITDFIKDEFDNVKRSFKKK
jgi:phage shock protein PspC (stress-responsive transcriptional regulator)